MKAAANKFKSWKWSNATGAERLLEEFDKAGHCLTFMPEASQQALHNPEKFVEKLFGRKPLAILLAEIQANPQKSGPQPYALTMDEARLHIDQHMYLPAPVQILICVKPAEDEGGASIFVDSWKILNSLKKRDHDLFEGLIEVPRIVRFPNLIWPAPTFSVRCGNLVCVQSGIVHKDDIVGQLFHNEIYRAKRTQFKLKAGEISISNNQRFLHSRTAFKDINRRLIRILAWFEKPFSAPSEFVDKAMEIAVHTESQAKKLPLEVRKRLGFSGKLKGYKNYSREDVLEQYKYGASQVTDTLKDAKKLAQIYAELSDNPELAEMYRIQI